MNNNQPFLNKTYGFEKEIGFENEDKEFQYYSGLYRLYQLLLKNKSVVEIYDTKDVKSIVEMFRAIIFLFTAKENTPKTKDEYVNNLTIGFINNKFIFTPDIRELSLYLFDLASNSGQQYLEIQKVRKTLIKDKIQSKG
jgi:hypothetical protein